MKSHRLALNQGLLLTMVTVLALLAAACSAPQGDSLTVYSGRYEDLLQPLIDRFEE